MTNVEYNEELHQYKIDGEIVPSVTELAKKFSGLNTEWLEKHPEFAERGTIMHNQLAEYYRDEKIPTDPKALAIKELIYRSPYQQIEALVYNTTLKYAGTIDMVVIRDKKCISVIDFKSGLNGNKRYYRCQLSLYMLALQDMGVDVSETRLFIVTPAGIEEFQPLSWEEMKDLCGDLLEKIDPDCENMRRVEFLEEQLDVLAQYVQKYNEYSRELKERLSQMFHETGTKRYTGSFYRFTMSPDGTRKTFDTEKAKLLLGDKATECEKITAVSGSIRMTELKKETNNE